MYKERLSQTGAIAVSAIAAIQWWLLADRADHIARMYWTFAEFNVTASVFGLCLFLICSLAGMALGITVTRRVHRNHGWPFHLARVSTAAIALGGVAWPAAVMSPLVNLVSR
jgi:hypothetical protein